MAYYKVVRVSDNKLYSALKIYGEYEVEYKINQWAYPKVQYSKLFVFDDLDMAREFYNGIKITYFPVPIELYEVECINPTRKRQKIISLYYNFNWQAKLIPELWKRQHNKKRYSHLCQVNHPIKHTICADAVKLVRRIEL